MMKKLFSVALVMILLIGLLPCKTLAASELKNVEVIRYDDGGYLEISVEMNSARVANTVSGSKKYTYYDGNGDVRWEAKLSATFAYSGGWYTCTTANCNVTIYDNQWYVISNTTTRSSNNAVTNLTMGRRLLGVTVEKPQYRITLSCDINGNLS